MILKEDASFLVLLKGGKMSLFAAGKCCVDCVNSINRTEKAECRNKMFNYLKEISDTVSFELDSDRISDDEFSSFSFFLRQLEIACFDCDGISGAVYKKIKEEYVEPVRHDIADIFKEIEKQNKLKKESKKAKKKGDNIVFIDFGS